MNLVKRDRYYYVWFSRTEAPPKGKLISLKKIVGHQVTTKQEARQALDVIKKQKLQEKIINLEKKSRRIPLQDFSLTYRSGARADLSDKTLAADELALRLLGDVVGHTKPVCLINANDLTEFKNICRSRGLSANTIATYLRHIKAALNWAKKHGYLESVPEVPRTKVPKRLPRAIPNKDVDAILAWAYDNDYELWRMATFALWTGCRSAEVLGLQHQYIDIYDQPTPAGVMGNARIIGKGDKERLVYLLPEAVRAIGEPKDVGRVFAAWHPHTISHRWKTAARAAGFEDYHFHGLRHTAAVRMIANGISIKVVQQILGHADISTTMIYTQLFDNIVENEMGKML